MTQNRNIAETQYTFAFTPIRRTSLANIENLSFSSATLFA
jgi:hypothetical protein